MIRFPGDIAGAAWFPRVGIFLASVQLFEFVGGYVRVAGKARNVGGPTCPWARVMRQGGVLALLLARDRSTSMAMPQQSHSNVPD